MTVMASLQRLAAVALATSVLVVVHPLPARASGDPPTAFEHRGDVVSGEPLYQRHCAACHGPSGRGDGQQGRAFDPGPPDFTAGGADAQRYYLATRDGGMAVGVSAAMPAFRHTLNEQQTRDIVAHLMRMAPRPDHRTVVQTLTETQERYPR
ncbi:MAG: c-type cytochrome [Lysobacteraceae bacterium]